MSDARPVAVVPAAGASRRFGGAKLVHDCDGQPLLERTLRSLFDGGVRGVVLVRAADDGLASVPLVGDLRVRSVTNVDPDRGMFSSILVGLAQLDAADSALILPADMPFVRPATVASLMQAHRATGDAVVAAYRGKRGHPLILPRSAWRRVLDQPVAATLKAALVTIAVEPVAIDVDDPGVVRDVDRPTDLDEPLPPV